MKTKHMQPILVGIAFIILSHLMTGVIFLTYYSTARYDDGFFFPLAFAIAAVYGWWSKNYLYSFLVGFFSIPLMISFFPPYFIPLTFVTNFLSLTNYNLLDTLIFCVFGIVSGLISMGFVKLHKIRSTK
ncbi:MAG: hypothetical protein KAX30_05185 [Candidatus Atribacteria bacterium]|jgi:H+/Cl- antiporter ClcA|nr:hypothetical protein [Candidatus Atribacteria bacterium]